MAEEWIVYNKSVRSINKTILLNHLKNLFFLMERIRLTIANIKSSKAMISHSEKGKIQVILLKRLIHSFERFL